jgi:hypothetical protein
MQTAIQKIELSNEHARMPSEYKPKFIRVQTLIEIKDTVEEEDEDEGESDVLRIQNDVQMRYTTSGMIERVLLTPNEISNSSSQLYHVGFPCLFLGCIAVIVVVSKASEGYG